MSEKKTASKGRPSKPADAKEEVRNNSPEAKAARFKLIAGRRTKKIITTLGNLSNCSNKNVYGYTPEQVEKIFIAIEKQTKLTKEKFAERAAQAKVDFDL